MPFVPPHLIETVRTRTAPRTLLGFLYALYATLMGCSVIAIGILADSSESGLILFVLIFMALITLAAGIGVPLMNAKAPGNLLLGEVNAREYAAITYLRSGDDKSGERVERLLTSADGATDVIDSTATEEPAPRPELPAAPRRARSGQEDT